jgi:hypothetical protein
MQPPMPPPPSDDPPLTAALRPTHLRARPPADIRARVDRSFVPFPETMSCMTQFDVAMGCTSVRGKFRQAYRYGGWRDCGAAWSDFWFCMRYRAYPDETKREAIAERYREKEEKILAGPNCQDVWEERERPSAIFQLGPRSDPRVTSPEADAGGSQ